MPAHRGVRTKLYPCRGSQMPCNQMISMNMSPPRPIDARRVDTLPALKALILNSESRNIGSKTLLSMNANAVNNATPEASIDRTNGLVQPIVS